MKKRSSVKRRLAARRIAVKTVRSIDHFLQIQAVSGAFLVFTTMIALIWANSSASDSYIQFWQMPLSFGLGDYVVSQTLHFWINDALMTIFFLVAGMEIRQEIHDGSLANKQIALLPIMAACGGVLVPALLYLTINNNAALHHGWAIPTATDIAFALGLLALFGKFIPPAVRILLLALAIIDDIIAVLIIAVFYSDGLDVTGLWISGLGIFLIFALQWLGAGSAYVYIIPGAILWLGLLKTGAHPSLSGVVMGLMTPVHSVLNNQNPLQLASRSLKQCVDHIKNPPPDFHDLVKSIKQLGYAQREMLPPAIRVQLVLHPWVAYLIMPLFALANAGVSFGSVVLNDEVINLIFGIAVALVIGKPFGILLSSWIVVRLGLCRLPEGMTWSWMILLGTLAGVGFTMSIFISNLAFDDANFLNAAKLGVLISSAIAGMLGLIVGSFLIFIHKKYNKSLSNNEKIGI